MKKKFLVTIKATVTKTMEVEADTEEDAIEQAHEAFTVECESDEEEYTQETVEVNDKK